MTCKVVALPTALIPPPSRFHIDPLSPPEGVAVFGPWESRARKLREDREARQRMVTTNPDRALLLGTIEALDEALEKVGVSGFGRSALRTAQTIAPRLDITMNLLCADAAWELYKARGGFRPPPKKAKRGRKDKRS